MVYSSRVLALLLALFIALIGTAFLWLSDTIVGSTLLVTFTVNFLVAYLVSFVVLDSLIFRKIKKVRKLIDKHLKKDLLKGGKQKKRAVNPLEKIYEEVAAFAVLKQQEIDELKKLEVFRKEFIADVSHELKTPIFAAQGFVHTLLDGAVDDKSVRLKFLKKAARSLDGLDVLVQDLLTLSHIETGQIKMQFDSIDLYALIQDVFEQLEDKAKERNIKLQLDDSPKAVMVQADRLRISQVMTNLVSNAIKHSFEDSKVMVRFDVSKKFITTYVSDKGEGIPKDHLGRIFERFYRVDKSRSREKGGTGLGLAIVKHILENHGTKAEVESSKGKGSTFSFRLPRVKHNQENLPEQSQKS